MQQVAQFKKLEDKKLPEDFDYSEVNSLRREAVQKLNTDVYKRQIPYLSTTYPHFVDNVMLIWDPMWK